jgi:hypothetical protein
MLLVSTAASYQRIAPAFYTKTPLPASPQQAVLVVSDFDGKLGT